jgi:hypothetical protein
MRLLVALCIAVLITPAAPAQPLYTLQDMINISIAKCINDRPGQPDASRFCTCWVNRWVGLWDENDRNTFLRTAVPTPHMVDMERVAASQCGG